MGSCTANSIGFAYEFNQHPDEPGEEKFVPSRLFIYYVSTQATSRRLLAMHRSSLRFACEFQNERRMEKSIEDDAGAQIRCVFAHLLLSFLLTFFLTFPSRFACCFAQRRHQVRDDRWRLPGDGLALPYDKGGAQSSPKPHLNRIIIT